MELELQFWEIKTFERKTDFPFSPDWNGILFIFSKKNKKIEWKAGRVLKRSKLLMLRRKVQLMS